MTKLLLILFAMSPPQVATVVGDCTRVMNVTLWSKYRPELLCLGFHLGSPCQALHFNILNCLIFDRILSSSTILHNKIRSMNCILPEHFTYNTIQIEKIVIIFGMNRSQFNIINKTFSFLPFSILSVSFEFLLQRRRGHYPLCDVISSNEESPLHNLCASKAISQQKKKKWNKFFPKKSISNGNFQQQLL